MKEMKYIIFALCLIPTLSMAQRKGYFTVSASGSFLQNQNPIVGAHFSANAQAGKNFFIGGEIGVMRFQSFGGVVVPLQLRTSFVFNEKPGKVSPMLILAPGIGIYNRTENGQTNSGGLALFAGGGIKFSNKTLGGGFINVGFASHTFTRRGDHVMYNGVALKIGAVIK